MSAAAEGTRVDDHSFGLFIFIRMWYHIFYILRHFHSALVPDVPLAVDSPGVGISLWCTNCRWLDHKLSILVGCRHHVMDPQASFNTGLTLRACADLSQTGHNYSAVE